jgi:hypothetical protein
MNCGAGVAMHGKSTAMQANKAVNTDAELVSV